MSETLKSQPREAQDSNPKLDSLAKLCSVGAVPIPDDLPEQERRKLLIAIAQLRQKRLLHLIAAAIAKDIVREQQN